MKNMQATTNNTKNNWIKFIPFRDLSLWDVKRYASERIQSDYPIVKLSTHIKEESHKVKLYDYPEKEFGILGVNNKVGIFDSYTEKGANINQAYKRMDEGWLAYNPYRVNVGSIGLRTSEHKHEYISPAYVVFSCKDTLLPDFLFKLFKTERFNKIINESTTGSVRQNLTIDILKTLDIALPPVNIQQKLLDTYYLKTQKGDTNYRKAIELEKEIENLLFSELGLNLKSETGSAKGLLQFSRYKDLIEWGTNKINAISQIKSTKFNTHSLSSKLNFLKDIFRGKSPFYKESSSNRILNQKCIKWNDIEIEHSKSVSEEWLNKIDNKIFTKEGDILINSTGEGTIGRSTIITKKYSGLMYDSHVLCLRLNRKLINPLFWVYVFNSTYGQKQVNDLKSAQSTQQTELGVNNVLKIQIPLPDMKNQNLIVSKIVALKDEISELKIKAEKSQRDAIREFEQSIFKS